MTRELLILRHGKSDWDAGTDDFNRPIQDRGKRGAQRIATWLMRQGLVPDYVVSSPAVRAKETASKACKAMGLGSDDVHINRAIYLATQGELLAVLAACPSSATRVMIVGHNPGMEDLLEYLASEPIPVPDDGKLLPTATLARLEMPDDWQKLPAGCAELQDLVRPATLPKKFPFPAPDGKELRDRPSYYYSQSSVIPFRQTKSGIEILVISSSKKKHFVVPKGIHDPGMTAETSAANEAWEEAGVEGEVLGEALGQYVYDKWGAECTVTVHPMRVNRMVPEAEWEESHRGREWVSPEQAKARLKQKELVPLVDVLVQKYG
jgi:phosphohistidine phosphatase